MSDTDESPSLIIKDSLEEKGTAGFASAAVSFLIHALVAMVISPIVVVVVFLNIVIIFHNSPGIDSALGAEGVASPVLWGPGLMLGLLVNRFALKSTACWVWLAGMVWLAYGIFVWLNGYHARFSGICSPFDSIRGGFFSFSISFCGNGEKVFRFTVPTFNSIAYSLGAWVALRVGRVRR